MIHVPLVWKFKVGITHVGIGAGKRAKSVDKAIDEHFWWWPLPTFVLPIAPPVPIPFGAYRVEQEMHRIMSRFKTDFYRGDGHSEWFNIAPLFFSVPIMLTIWGLYLAGVDAVFGTTLYPTYRDIVLGGLYWLVNHLISI